MKFLVFIPILLFSYCQGWAETSFHEEIKPIIQIIEEMVSEKKIHPVVAIGGCPGVGKTTFAKLLQHELSEIGIRSLILSLDHYKVGQKERKQLKNPLDPRRIAWSRLHNTFVSIQQGETKITKPTIDQLTAQMSEQVLDLTHIDCILFEGLYVLGNFSPMNFSQYIDLALYLETSIENIYDWKWERECKKLFPRTAEEFFYHMKDILQDFAFHVYPTKKYADYIIEADFFHHYSISNDPSIHEKTRPDFTFLREQTFVY